MKKVLANSGKGSTFAPAFGRNDGTEEGRKREFFESLRPAQTSATEKRREARNLITKEHQLEHQGGTRDSE